MSPVVALLSIWIPLAGHAGLVPLLDSGASLTRVRAAYALARTSDPADGRARGRLARVLRNGSGGERVAVIRGLSSRHWPNGMPGEVEAQLLDLLEDPDPAVRKAVIDGVRNLPRVRAAEVLLAELPKVGLRSSPAHDQAHIFRTAMELDVKEIREPFRRELHRRTESLQWRAECTLRSCMEELAGMAWLGENVGLVLGSIDRDLGAEYRVEYQDRLRLLRIAGIKGDASAIASLVREGRAAVAPQVRRDVFSWLVAMPPAIRPDVVDAVIGAAVDPDPVLRARGVTALAVDPPRYDRHARVADAFARALSDREVDIRLEGAVGLFDLHRFRGARVKERITEALAEESDPVVRAVLEAARVVE